MSIHPINPPHLLTVSEYLEIGEIDPGYSELVEGRLLMSPSPAPDHNRAVFKICSQLDAQLPRELEVLLDLDVDLQLALADGPGTVRRPDLVVVPREARIRVRREGGVLRASDAIVVIEVVSPGSRRIDLVHKRGEYADAGIPHYWIVDISPPVSLVAAHLAGEFGYIDTAVVTGRFSTTEPVSVDLDLDVLL
jgi:Uma2 family endonuclease